MRHIIHFNENWTFNKPGETVAESMHAYMQSLPLPQTSDYPDVPTAETISASAQAEQLL